MDETTAWNLEDLLSANLSAIAFKFVYVFRILDTCISVVIGQSRQ